MTSLAQYVRSESVVSRVIAGETLIVPVRRGTADLASLYSFNPTGNTIWQALEKPKTIDELVNLLAETYDVSEDQARQDVDSFLAEAQAMGLIRTNGQ